MQTPLAALRAKTAYLDGELCGVGADGLPSFAETQAATDGARGARLVFYAFDLLHLDGRDTARLPLVERKALLHPVVTDIPGLQFNGHETGDGELIRRNACQLGYEGVVSKTVDAPYASGNRDLWRKAKCLNRQEFVIVGWSDPEGSRRSGLAEQTAMRTLSSPARPLGIAPRGWSLVGRGGGDLAERQGPGALIAERTRPPRGMT
jgi:ATP-dependent DNA ligase